MQIDFFTVNSDDNIGSYRIWVRDLSRSINESGNSSRIFSGTISEDIAKTIDSDSDAIVICKSACEFIPDIRSAFKNIKIGAINIPRDYISKDIDFVIVGSPEELCSMGNYENVFIYPLIERQFENIKIKNHEETEKLRICFHGHYPHLGKFSPSICQALENISSNIEIELVIITGNPEFDWVIGKPNGIKIENHKYSVDTISEIIQSCDIGIVPNVMDMSVYLPKSTIEFCHSDIGLYNTDYQIRFKNKTNGGRAYVFYQHGLPVIHDLSPSSFEFMSKTGRYIVAHDAKSWEKEIRRLYNHKLRNIISNENKNIFEEHYNPVNKAKDLLKFIKDIK
jgi:hypothetical protein